jgi:catechol 2,3-dioxygenase-like lactoylglutathione lyase family enzyme
MKHLALAVSDQQRSRRFYEKHFGFDAQPARRYDDGVLMLYNRDGFALALGETDESIRLPTFLHFGMGLPTPDVWPKRDVKTALTWPSQFRNVPWCPSPPTP